MTARNQKSEVFHLVNVLDLAAAKQDAPRIARLLTLPHIANNPDGSSRDNIFDTLIVLGVINDDVLDALVKYEEMLEQSGLELYRFISKLDKLRVQLDMESPYKVRLAAIMERAVKAYESSGPRSEKTPNLDNSASTKYFVDLNRANRERLFREKTDA